MYRRSLQSNVVPVSASQPCPLHPLDLCDFFMDGSRDDVPLLLLPDPSKGDFPISAGLRDSHRRSDDPLGWLEVDTTGAPHYLCPSPPGTDQGGLNSGLSDVFYISSDQNQAKIKVRNLGNVNRTSLYSRCIVLPIKASQVHPKNSTGLVNLDENDGNHQYPEQRRCVVFKTGPTAAPQCPWPSCYSPPATQPSSLAASFSEKPAAPLCGCPKAPSERCDFSFDGYAHEVPSFSLGKGNGDTSISSRIVYSSAGSNDSSSGSDKVAVTVDGTNDPIQGLECNSSAISPDDQHVFYATGPDAQVFVRKPQDGFGGLVDRCILLPLTQMQIVLPGSTGPLNLSPGDGNQIRFPQSRRCVVFRTKV